MRSVFHWLLEVLVGYIVVMTILMPLWIATVPRESWPIQIKRVTIGSMASIATLFIIPGLIRPNPHLPTQIIGTSVSLLYLTILYVVTIYSWRQKSIYTPPLDFWRFYTLEDPLAAQPLRVNHEGDHLTIEQAIQLFRGKWKPDSPIKLSAYQGGQATDFLWSCLPPLVCISQRVVDVLQTNNITGWSTYTVEVYGRKGELLPGYHGFAVTGGDCRRDRSRSLILTRRAALGGELYHVYSKLFFLEEDWDGSDIFWVKSFGGIVVTDKVRKTFRRAKVKNAKLTPLPNVEIDVLLDKIDTDLQAAP